GRTVTPPTELNQRGQVALTDLLVDADGKVRRGLLSHDNPADQLRLGLGPELALRYLAERGILLEVIEPEQKVYRLGQTDFVPFRSNDGGYIRTNAGGYQTLINFRGHANRFPQISLTEVLNNQLEPDMVRDRIVIIGSVAPSLNDLFYTPYSSRLINTPEATPGVVVHANLASALLSSALEGRAVIRVWAEPLEWAWILVWSGVGALGYWRLIEANRHSQRVLTRLAVWIASVVLAGGILLASSCLAFLAGWWIPVVPSFLALFGSASAIAGYEILKLQQYRAELAQQNLKLEQDKIRAEVASQAKSQFLAKMSHELRTPLNTILGFTQLMSQDLSLDPQQKESLNIITLSGEHLLNLINDVLEISKIEAGRVVLHKTSFDLHDLLDTLQAMLAPKAVEKGLQFQIEYDSDIPKFVTTDEGKLRQVLINLLNNAIKFTSVGSVTLRVRRQAAGGRLRREHASTERSPNVSAERSQGDGRDGGDRGGTGPASSSLSSSTLILHFEVEDTGPGIAPDEVSTLFDIFTQGKAGQTAFEGVGLGLPISQQLVHLMGGEITVKTVLNQGTTFQFDIQASLTPTPQVPLPPTQQVVGLAPDQRSFRLLIAEDEPVSRKLLTKLLTSLGFEVRAAANGKEAVELWEKWHPDLIWMDMQMPVMDGCEATRWIREVQEPKSPIIIALTASAFEADRERSLAAGCDDFVSKPFRRDEILAKMSHYLGVRYQ
ncbi:MAG: CHASE2 domain-containing protein, partial [Cyanobacteria bacterium P01_G01_bin.38]